jgi:hypothetical protein
MKGRWSQITGNYNNPLPHEENAQIANDVLYDRALIPGMPMAEVIMDMGTRNDRIEYRYFQLFAFHSFESNYYDSCPMVVIYESTRYFSTFLIVLRWPQDPFEHVTLRRTEEIGCQDKRDTFEGFSKRILTVAK